MRQKKMMLSSVLMLAMGIAGVQAQETISAAGGNASSSGGSVSYSVGQLVFTTQTGTNGSVAQGVQQPFEISIVTGTEESNIILQCSAYPNPSTDFLILEVENSAKQNLSYQLYEMNGKLLENKKLISNKTTIQMENLVPAIYFLQVSSIAREIKTFKIIKN